MSLRQPDDQPDSQPGKQVGQWPNYSQKPSPDYKILYKLSVAKELRKLGSAHLKAVVRRIEALASNPRPVGCIRLQGKDELYRVRQGDYRIIYAIRDENLVVMIVKIGHRKEVYGRH